MYTHNMQNKNKHTTHPIIIPAKPKKGGPFWLSSPFDKEALKGADNLTLQ